MARYSLVLHKIENNRIRDNGERGYGKQFIETEVPGVLGTYRVYTPGTRTLKPVTTAHYGYLDS